MFMTECREGLPLRKGHPVPAQCTCTMKVHLHITMAPLFAPDINEISDDGDEILHSINALGAQRNLKRTQ